MSEYYISEPEYLIKLQKELDVICAGWILGDQEKSDVSRKTADLVNRKELLAIEVKDDFKEAAPDLSEENPFFERTRDLTILTNRYKHDIED